MAETVSEARTQEAGQTATGSDTTSGPAFPVVAMAPATQTVASSVGPTTAADSSVPSPVSSPSIDTFVSVPAEAPPRAVYPFGWSRRDVRRTALLLAAALIACLFLWRVEDILPPFLIAFFLAALLDPTLRYYEQRGRSRVRSIVTLYLLTLSAIVLLVLRVVPAATLQIQEISGNLDSYYQGIQQSADEFLGSHQKALNKLGIKQQHLSDLIRQQSDPIQKAVAATLGSFTGLVQGIASKLLWLIIIPIASFFFMLDFPMLRARIIALFPEPYHDKIDEMSREIVDVFSAYLRGLAKICALYSLVAFVLFWLLGLRYALFLGLLAGTFYAVPYVGQLVTAVACGSVAFLTAAPTALFFWHPLPHSIGYAGVVVVCAIVTQNVFDQILYPRIVGGSVGLHPVVSIFALSAGATLFGIWGMLMAVPVAASLQILLTFFFPKLTQPPPARLLEQPPPLA